VLDVILKRFEQPDETRTFSRGRFELVHIGGMTIGRATHEPGWKWSVDVGGAAGIHFCNIEHVGLVICGKAVAAMQDGRIIEMNASDLFYIAPGHDSWVVGDEPTCPCISWAQRTTPSMTRLISILRSGPSSAFVDKHRPARSK